LGHVRLGHVRLDHVRLGHVRLSHVRLDASLEASEVLHDSYLLSRRGLSFNFLMKKDASFFFFFLNLLL